MFVVGSRGTVNLKNVSSVTMNVNTTRCAITVMFDGRNNVVNVFLNPTDDRVIKSEFYGLGDYFRENGLRVGYVISEWLKENAEKDGIITVYRFIADVLEMLGCDPCKSIAEVSRLFDREMMIE